MNELERFLGALVANPLEETGWGALADYLDENDDPRRGELLRAHRELLHTCCEPDMHPERATGQARIVELIGQGVRPCVPQETLTLPRRTRVPMTFSFIPPGRFLMGSSPELDHTEGPIRVITLTKGFYLGTYPVTQSQWRAVMGTERGLFRGAARPVEGISWREAVVFCTRLSELTGREARLPTEAQWEYACRAGTTTDHYTGNNEVGLERAAWCRSNSDGETHPVGLRAPNAWGLFDMHGNVVEWVDGPYVFYRALPDIDPHYTVGWTSSSHGDRVKRGGCFASEADSCRSAHRSSGSPDDAGIASGFRVALSLPQDAG